MIKKIFQICICIIILMSSLNVNTVDASQELKNNNYNLISEKNNELSKINESTTIVTVEIGEGAEFNLKKDIAKEKKRLKQIKIKKEKKERDKIRKALLNTDSKNNKCNIDKKHLKYLGEYKLTAYCPFSCCCGSYGISNNNQKAYTSSGAVAKEGETIAVDPKVIPYGTTVIIEINGTQHKYIAQDCGGAIKGNIIDVFFDSHEKTEKFGVKYGKIYILKNS